MYFSRVDSTSEVQFARFRPAQDRHKIMPVIDLDFWPIDTAVPAEKMTTIASWRSFAPIQYQGEWYEEKAVEFKRFLRLPSKIKRSVEVALSIHEEDDLAVLRSHRVGRCRPTSSGCEPYSHRAYIAHSRAELDLRPWIRKSPVRLDKRSECGVLSLWKAGYRSGHRIG
jgi:hypothetical protein